MSACEKCGRVVDFESSHLLHLLHRDSCARELDGWCDCDGVTCGACCDECVA